MAQLRSMPAEQQRRTRYHRLLLLFVLLLAQSVAGRRGNLHIDDEWIFFKVLAVRPVPRGAVPTLVLWRLNVLLIEAQC